MGKEKKLFLLAVMTVLMSTAGYSAQITVGNKEDKKNETVLEVGKETGVDNKGTFTNNNTINVNTSEETGVFGINNIGGTSTNNGTITAQKGNKGTAIKISGGTVTNGSTGKIILEDGKGIYISAGKNQTPTLNNENIIEINGGTGINMQSGTVVNTGEININRTNNGIVLGHNSSSFENKGTITIKNGATVDENNNAIKVSKGELKNSGTITNGDKITIEGGKFVNEKDGVVTNETTGKITITGGEFTNNAGGTVNNAGEIIISDGKFTNKSDKKEEGSINKEVNNTGSIIITGGEFNNEKGATVNNNEKGIIEITNGTFKNYGTLQNSSKSEINILGGTFGNNSNGKIENNGTINISGGILNNEKTATITNKGTINISNGELVHKNGATFNNNKDINISGGKLNNIGTLKNTGTITIIKNGVLELSKASGNLENENLIKVEDGATGIELSNGTFNNNGIKDENDKVVSLGKVEVSGAGTIGINQTGGTFNNYAVIEVKNGATGVKLSNGAFNNDVIKDKKNEKILSYSEINVSGENSIGLDISEKGKLGKVLGSINVSDGATGIKVNQGTENPINYNGVINVNQGTGVEVLGGTFITKKTINVQNQGTGIKLSGGAVNNSTTGKIDVQGQGIGVDIIGGKFTNKNIVNVAKGNGTGVKVDGGNFINEKKVSVYSGIGVNVINGEFTNKKNINSETKKEEDAIYVSAGTGINIEKDGKVTNEGKINVSGGNGIGVALNNSMFVNSGEIFGKGIAIKSVKGNNTVYLKNGSKVTGKIVGADGIDVLALEGTKEGKIYYNGLNVEKYDKISVVKGNVEIGKNSKIELEYNKDEEGYKDKTNEIIGETSSGNLTMSGSSLIIDFKDSLTNPNGSENPIIDVGTNGKLIFGEGMKLDFTSSDGRDVFNVNEALGLKDGQITYDENLNFDDIFKDTAVWEYNEVSGEIIAKKHKYEDVILKSELKDFAGIFGNQDNFNKDYKDTLSNLIPELNLLDTKGEFTNVMTQMSGAVHGYVVDFAALNARTLTNTMRSRALTRDYMRKRPLNSWTQDVMYIDNNHRLGGLMDVNYTEKGVLGISEKQILPNGRLGLVYGGSKGNADFAGGENGSSSLDGAYFGGYYNHEFNDKWSLNSNANFVYTHNKVTRNVDLTYGEGNNKVENPTFKSTYPTYTVGMGTSLIYTVKDDLRNKAHFYAGVDVERIMVGNINENRDQKDDNTGLAVKKQEKDGKTYYSIVPSAGFMVQNTGYVFDRKYRIGADLNWETEVGNIKDGKRIKLTGLDKEYKVETSEREDVFSYSLFGALDLTESLSVNAKYTSMFSDEYDADMIGAGFEYKMDTMADNFFGTLAHKLENRRTFSDRWAMTLGFMMETDDADDFTDLDNGTPVIGENITSMEYKPRLTLSINDKKSNWSYFFDVYHKTNDLFGSQKGGEKESHASRYHGEARWNDTYSKGTYGMSFGYRNETSEKPYYITSKRNRETNKNGTHELRLTPSFSYDLGHNFTLSGKSAIVFMYKYEGDREGQMDMNTESQVGIGYSGFMPRWDIAMNFYREDTWYDRSNRKLSWSDKGYTEVDNAPKKDQVNQLRPSIVYYFGNGANVRFDARIPLGNGKWVNNNDGTKGNESYETRYGINYTFPVAPGFTATVGGTFLNYKDKTTKGETQRYYAFRPNIGFSYSF